MAIATGLGAGYQPIGAVLVSKAIYETILGASGFFQHGHTCLGHAAACAGALAVQKRLHEDGAGVRDPGVRGDHVLLAPPFIAGEAQLDELVAKLAGAITKSIPLEERT